MNVYFTASTANLERDQAKYQKIIHCLESAGHHVSESWLLEKITNKLSKLTSREILLKNIQLLQESDFVVLELSTPSLGVGYCIGQAIANYRKILCLYPQGIDKNEISEIVTGSTSALLTYCAYDQDNLEQVIRDYIAGLNMDNLRKFNFIANEQIIQYIADGALKEGKSKSEFLRDKILKEFIHK
ncbi:MAG: nucleoside 2-deoxyribosyltransferase [bacterium]